MSLKVHIYLSPDKAVQVLFEGSAHGALSFPDYGTFVRFIEGCKKFIEESQHEAGGASNVPQPFLDAFNDM